MSLVQLTVNGRLTTVEIAPRTSLADVLREQLRLTGTHLGCEHGVCGACTVLLDGEPVRSCIVLGVACESRNVRTIEGFEDDAIMAALRAAFKREHGLQCGFCTPGMLIAARDIVVRLDGPDEARIRRELAGNLCRCTGYVGIVRAVRDVVATKPAEAATLHASPGTAAVAPDPARAVEAATPPPSPAPIAAAPSAADAIPAGWTRFSESFAVHGDPGSVWLALVDIPLVASCLPGAEVTEYDEAGHVKARFNLKLGAIRASMSGSAVLTRNDAERSAELHGAGSDRRSGSRTQGRMTFSVAPNVDGPGSRVSVRVAYNLQGPLAQFSRSGVAQEVGRLLIEQFARNLNDRLSGERDIRIQAAMPLNLAVFWKALLARLFRRKAKDRD